MRPGRILFRHYFPMTLAGGDLVPDGPVVVAANHFSHLDPVVAGLAVGRPIRYLAVDELFGNSRFFDNLTLWLGAIPMSRTRVPLGALRLATEELASGGTVGVFPEGVRVWRWGEQEARRGAAWLARRMNVPLLPVAIAGSDEAMGRGTERIRRRPMHAEVCEPILPGDFVRESDPLGSMTSLWRDRIDEVLGRWYG
ncbi:MAG: 1-acyl-sn-glycerol-3-phosphate acyltransferase [Actinobacteria bacterium]|nr:1-acyl-sn-glycerol-3-phosphate acyltransferase [Actinomycetota bacterium]MBU1492745.1 1-acyl-sn-glycerol-3-phosphate acyltransferase [Actinomycetota bacterium]MBU1866365.1 1-acyl-sn-glycerol-3-phosphate acyltransferase [Actinomycetota bacterium]